MKYLHTMLRVRDLDEALEFFVDQLGLTLRRRHESTQGRFTLAFLAAGNDQAEIELTYNWDQKEAYSRGRFFGHLAFSVPNIYAFCDALQKKGVTILRPPRDGRMAFIKSPDGHSVEILQAGEALPPEEPWVSLANQGEW